MSKPSPARYRTTNWSRYTASLRKRGSLLIWLDKEMTWLAPHDSSPGRPVVFSDAAIHLSLLPQRITPGVLGCLRPCNMPLLSGVSGPDCTARPRPDCE